MLPREHGAYSQMALPLATSLVIAGGSPAGLFITIAVVCGFLAHEPLLVLLGGRGARALKATQPRATVWFAVTVVAMVAAGAAAVRFTPVAVRWSLLLPLVPAAWVVASAFTRQEKQASTQIAVALAFALATIPICLGAGIERATAISIAFVFASVYVTGVLCVRTIVLGKRGGGNPAASRATRRALVLIVAGSALTIGVAIAGAWMRWPSLIAALPGLATAVMLAIRRSPPPLKTVGWSLALTSAAAALILIGTLMHRA
jgi:YwiC-like protein